MHMRKPHIRVTPEIERMESITAHNLSSFGQFTR